MKLTVKTLKGSHVEITVQSSDTLLIHNGKVLKDETTLAENKVSEDGFLVVMLGKSKTLGTVGVSSTQPSPTNPPTTALVSNSTPAPEVPVQPLVSKSTSFASDTTTSRNHSISMNLSYYLERTSGDAVGEPSAPTGTYGQAASNLVAEGNLEQTIQQIMDIGSGNWDRETVACALRAAYNHPERAVDYLYSLQGIPEAGEVAVSVAPFPASQATGIGAATAPVSGLPNASPLNMFPQETVATADGGGGGLGSLEFLRNNPQLQALCSMVQSNPQILQPMLQEMVKQNPQLLRLIEEHQTEFLQMINEPPEGSEGDAFDQPERDMPHGINVTPAEQEAIDRLEAMGFDRALVIEAFLACDHNEELAANYLLENAGAWRF